MARNQSGEQPQQPDRFTEFIREITLGTRVLMAINIAVYFYTLAAPDESSKYSICAGPVLWLHEYYRIVTSAFFHAGLLHVGFNMMTLWSLGGAIERALGTVCFIGANVMFVVLPGLVYILASWIAFKATDDTSWLVYCSVGYSGCLFSLVVLETRLGDHLQPRSLFGFCNVPAAVYPWALLILLQIMMPGISFLGHLSGILCGAAYIAGLLPWCSLKRSWVLGFEQRVAETTNGWSSFVACPAQSPFPAPQLQCLDSLVAQCTRWGSACATWFRSSAPQRSSSPRFPSSSFASSSLPLPSFSSSSSSPAPSSAPGGDVSPSNPLAYAQLDVRGDADDGNAGPHVPSAVDGSSHLAPTRPAASAPHMSRKIPGLLQSHAQPHAHALASAPHLRLSEASLGILLDRAPPAHLQAPPAHTQPRSQQPAVADTLIPMAPASNYDAVDDDAEFRRAIEMSLRE